MAAAVPSIVRAPGVTPGADCNVANQADRPGVPDLVVLVSEASATCQLLADVPAKWEDRPQRTITRNAVSLLLSQFASAPDSDFSEGWGLFDVHLQLAKLRELDAKVVAHSSLDLSGCKTFDQACHDLVALAGVIEDCTMAPLVAGGNWEAKYPVIAKDLVHILTSDWIEVRDTFKTQDFRLPHRS